MLQPAPGWSAIKQALAATACGTEAARAVQALLPEGRELRALQLFDLLWTMVFFGHQIMLKAAPIYRC